METSCGVVLCRSLEGTLTPLLRLARLSGVSQLDTDSAELFTRAGRRRGDGQRQPTLWLPQFLLHHYPSPCLCWQLSSQGPFLPPKSTEVFHGCLEKSVIVLVNGEGLKLVLAQFYQNILPLHGLKNIMFCSYFSILFPSLVLKRDVAVMISVRLRPNLYTLLSALTLPKTQTLCPWRRELRPFEVSHLSFIRQSNNSEVPVDIWQNSRTGSVSSSVCVGEESLML